MAPGVPTKVIGACSGLAAFAVALIAGLAAQNPAETTLIRALVSMLACQAVGWVIGALGERTVRDALSAYKAANPVGGPPATGSGRSEAPAATT